MAAYGYGIDLCEGWYGDCCGKEVTVLMTTKEFAEHVEKHATYDLDDQYCVIALNGEAGEVAEWYKKYVLRKNVIGKHTEQDLLFELGDVLYYLTRLGMNHGWTLDTIMEANEQKLDKRVK